MEVVTTGDGWEGALAESARLRYMDAIRTVQRQLAADLAAAVAGEVPEPGADDLAVQAELARVLWANVVGGV